MDHTSGRSYKQSRSDSALLDGRLDLDMEDGAWIIYGARSLSNQGLTLLCGWENIFVDGGWGVDDMASLIQAIKG